MKPNQSILLTGAVLFSLFAWATPALSEDDGPAPVQGPDTLFLTWYGDPTTSIVAQWLEEGVPMPLIEGASDDIPALETPKLTGITIDGDFSDWEGKGLDAGYLAGDEGLVYDDADLSAAAKIGWDDRGLLILVRVKDSASTESDDLETLWSADSVELFISTGVGSGQRYQVLVAPGVTRSAEADADTEDARPRHWQYDYRSDRSGGDVKFEYASTAVEGGYVIEVRLPWTNLAIDPAGGERVGFQFYVNDKDGEEDIKNIWWHPDNDANERPESMYALRLTEKAGAAATARAKVVRHEDNARLVVWGDTDLAGQTVQAICADKVIGETTFYEKRGSAKAKIDLDAAPEGSRWGTIHVIVDDEPVAYARPLRWMSVSRPEISKVTCDKFVAKVGQAPSTSIDTSVTPFGDYSGMFLHRVEYQDLNPDTEYALKIQKQEQTTTHRFRTAPATLDEPLVFAEGGDVGIWQNVAPLHKVAASWSPRFGLIGGDCAYGNGRTPENWVAYLRLWREHMVDPEGRLIPMLCAIGNHEVDGSFGQPRERSPFFLALFGGLYPEHTYAAIDFGDYLSLVLLDSGHVSAHGEGQRAWLNETLAARTDRQHLFTAYHVPAYPSHRDFEGKYSALAREHWVPLFDQYGVDVSFEHHDHTYKRTHHLTAGERDIHGVLYLGDGAWGMSPRRVATPKERPYLAKSVSSSHVIRVTLDGKSRRFLAVDEKGRAIDRYYLDD